MEEKQAKIEASLEKLDRDDWYDLSDLISDYLHVVKLSYLNQSDYQKDDNYIKFSSLLIKTIHNYNVYDLYNKKEV